MRFKKILIIPLLFFGYIWFINAMVSSNVVTSVSQSEKEEVSGAEVVGVGTAVTVQVTRTRSPYLFGLVSLPNYVDGIGNMRSFHNIFFYFLGILTIGLIIIEWRSVKWQKRKK